MSKSNIRPSILRPATFLMLFFHGNLLKAQFDAVPQNQVEATFLYNFTQFVEWPPEAFTQTNAPFIIGIFGKNPFNSYLEETVRNETMNGHPIIIRQFNSIDSISSCHMLFVNTWEEKKIRAVLLALKGHCVLTVSNNKRFTGQGGMIRFLNDDNKIKLLINISAVKEAKLTVSSKLLRLATITGMKKT